MGTGGGPRGARGVPFHVWEWSRRGSRWVGTGRELGGGFWVLRVIYLSEGGTAMNSKCWNGPQANLHGQLEGAVGS